MWLKYKRKTEHLHPTVERFCSLKRSWAFSEWDNTSSLGQSQCELLRHALSLIRSSERSKVQDCLSPLLAGGCVNVHALRAGQGLGLRLQAVRWRAGERTDALAALAAVSNPYSNGEHKRKHCVWVRTCWLSRKKIGKAAIKLKKNFHGSNTNRILEV